MMTQAQPRPEPAPPDMTSAMAPIGDADILYLPRGVRLEDDRVRGIRILQAPERAMQLDQVGDAILSELDGRIGLGTLVDRLARKYDAPRDQIREDVCGFLTGLVERRMVFIRGRE